MHDHAEINEVNYGVLYKQSKKWVEKHIPEYKNDPEYIFEQGESFSQMQKRSVDFFSSLPNKYNNETILIVAHAGVIRGLISHYLGLDYRENLKQKITHRYIGQFNFKGTDCESYTEIGKPSGFIENNIIRVPFHCARREPSLASI